MVSNSSLDISKKLEDEIRDLQPTWIALLVTDSRKQIAVNVQVIKTLLNKGMKGIYVTLNKPASAISSMLEEGNRTLTEGLYFVDCVTELVAGPTKRTHKCIYLHPSNLTGIYGNIETMEKFVQFITSRARTFNLESVLFSIERDMDTKMLDVLSKLCDKVIEI